MAHRKCAWAVAIVVGLVGAVAQTQAAETARLPNPFYAMDTAFRRPGLDQAQQFALVKELGYDGIGWHDEAPERAKANAVAMEKAGLKMSAIYCAAKAAPAGTISHSPRLPALMTSPIALIHNT